MFKVCHHLCYQYLCQAKDHVKSVLVQTQATVKRRQFRCFPGNKDLHLTQQLLFVLLSDLFAFLQVNFPLSKSGSTQTIKLISVACVQGVGLQNFLRLLAIGSSPNSPSIACSVKMDMASECFSFVSWRDVKLCQKRAPERHCRWKGFSFLELVCVLTWLLHHPWLLQPLSPAAQRCLQCLFPAVHASSPSAPRAWMLLQHQDAGTRGGQNYIW